MRNSYHCSCGAVFHTFEGMQNCVQQEHYIKTELSDAELIKRIQDALGTAETGFALVEVARNAHRAEQAWAAHELLRDQLIESNKGNY